MWPFLLHKRTVKKFLSKNVTKTIFFKTQSFDESLRFSLEFIKSPDPQPILDKLMQRENLIICANDTTD